MKCFGCTSQNYHYLTPQEVHINYVAAGLTLSLRGQRIANGSDVVITDIGIGPDNALTCETDQKDCCNTAAGNQRGEWIFPDNTIVARSSEGGDFFINRRYRQVLLNRRNNATGPLGSYCCDVDTMDDPNATICINISKQ